MRIRKATIMGVNTDKLKFRRRITLRAKKIYSSSMRFQQPKTLLAVISPWTTLIPQNIKDRKALKD